MMWQHEKCVMFLMIKRYVLYCHESHSTEESRQANVEALMAPVVDRCRAVAANRPT